MHWAPQSRFNCLLHRRERREPSSSQCDLKHTYTTLVQDRHQQISALRINIPVKPNGFVLMSSPAAKQSRALSLRGFEGWWLYCLIASWEIITTFSHGPLVGLYRQASSDRQESRRKNSEQRVAVGRRRRGTCGNYQVYGLCGTRGCSHQSPYITVFLTTCVTL